MVGDEATLTYTIPMPNDDVTQESAAVLDFVQSGLPGFTVDRTGLPRFISLATPSRGTPANVG